MSSSSPTSTSYPTPRRVDLVRTAHGLTYDDPYAWMRDDDREDGEVLEHLRAENAYTSACFGRLEQDVDALFREIRSRIKLDNESVPVYRRKWWYWRATTEANQYPVHMRSRNRDRSAAQVVIDENELAKEHEFFDLLHAEVSPDGQLLAYIVDYQGNELGELHIRDLSSGVDLADIVPAVEASLAWSADSTTVLYAKSDQTRRSCEVWSHKLGNDAAQDIRLYHEPDARFNVMISSLKGDQLLDIAIHSYQTTEHLLLDAHDLSKAPVAVRPRQSGVEYSVDYDRDRSRVIVLHNIKAQDFSLQSASIDLITLAVSAEWHDLVDPDPNLRIDDFEIFADHLAMFRRHNATTDVCVRDLRTNVDTVIDFGEPLVTVGGGANPDSASPTMRLGATSMTMPASVFDYHVYSGELELLKRTEVLGGYDPTDYVTTRAWARAKDGVEVPMTIVHAKTTTLDGSAPTLIYAYAAYEISMDTWFSPSRLSLLDRGAVFVVVHARGGGELGRRWYLDGKFAKKTNTFDDTIACTEYLINQKMVDPARIALRGGSAGGLLVGATINRAPHLFCAAIAEVPFVDCLTTMCDPSIPLTTAEYEEWGNPTDDASAYADIRGYSPINNVQATTYPRIFATAGYEDRRVGYWEPAKWVATLRETVTNPQDVWAEFDLAGHQGPSERDSALREEAKVLAFILDAWGISP